MFQKPFERVYCIYIASCCVFFSIWFFCEPSLYRILCSCSADICQHTTSVYIYIYVPHLEWWYECAMANNPHHIKVERHNAGNGKQRHHGGCCLCVCVWVGGGRGGGMRFFCCSSVVVRWLGFQHRSGTSHSELYMVAKWRRKFATKRNVKAVEKEVCVCFVCWIF